MLGKTRRNAVARWLLGFFSTRRSASAKSSLASAWENGPANLSVALRARLNWISLRMTIVATQIDIPSSVKTMPLANQPIVPHSSINDTPCIVYPFACLDATRACVSGPSASVKEIGWRGARPGRRSQPVDLLRPEYDWQRDPDLDLLVAVQGRRELHDVGDFERSLVEGVVAAAVLHLSFCDIAGLIDQQPGQNGAANAGIPQQRRVVANQRTGDRLAVLELRLDGIRRKDRRRF